MTRILLLPVTRRSALSCVWIETGNPKQPLARVWVDREMRIFDAAGRQEEAQPCCA